MYGTAIHARPSGDPAGGGSTAPRAAHDLLLGDAAIALLSLSPVQCDHDALRSLLPAPPWVIHSARSLSASVMEFLRQSGIALVVCERDLMAGTWREALDSLMGLPRPPYLIVTSRVADEFLWAEALNLGAHDVLAKPFDRLELIRVLTSAWRHWRDRYQRSAPPAKAMRA
jgi:DNA-binding response OmpR family regulator